MLDDALIEKLQAKLDALRSERANNESGEAELNYLIADIMNGLEALFIIVNARVAQESTPQTNRAVFVSTSKPNKPKML